MSDDDINGIDALVRDAPVAAPPAGFADRVLSARVHALVRRRARGAASAVVALMAVAAALLLLPRASHGSLVANARETHRLGDSSSVVVEPGTELRFEVVAALGPDTIDVIQSAGSAFYRVEPGNHLAVTTPAGTVRVHGTCFRVDVTPEPKEPAMLSAAQPFPRTLVAGAAGALIGAALAVVVFEGRVEVANQHGVVMVEPGQTATARAGRAPTSADVSEARLAQLALENDDLTRAIEGARASAGGDAKQLLAENQALRDQLKQARALHDGGEAARRAQEGEPQPFPADLPARFSEVALQKAFDAALNEAGIEGGVIQIDCGEYPCVVYGQLSSKDDMDKLRAAPSLTSYADDADHTSLWHSAKEKNGKKVESAYFGIAFAPKEDGAPDDEETTPAYRKRLRTRMQNTSDTLFGGP